MPVYLDHSATTPTDGRAFDAMLPFLREHDGNPLSRHRLVWAGRSAIDTGRASAEPVGARAPRAVFASGGIEANNLEPAITGMAGVRPAVRRIAG